MAAIGLAVLLSLGLVVYETPVSPFLRQHGVRVGARLDVATVLLTVVLLFDVGALALLLASTIPPH